jgi:16S rRNA A1518/A1519 N6-dimethyltransferase RsmA/KsgA/DIM1 with predicted DNA glycosylase/AP lyase activity
MPKVDSVIIKITPRTKFDFDAKKLFRVAKAGFAGKRKQLHNTLSSGLGLSSETVKEVIVQAGLDAQVRPQMLSPEQWIKLSKLLMLAKIS